MSAVASRERRATAGKRMSSLVGKAQDEDDEFWSHETWAEDDSGNESFRESDEDSEQRVDKFDSDFDDSETDNDAEEVAAGAEEEMELLREERGQKRKQKFDIVKAGRELMQKKKGKGKKRAMGDGVNAGLVLNMPPPLTDGAAPLPTAAAVVPLKIPSAASSPSKILKPSPASTRSSKRSSRSTTSKRSLRAATLNKSQQAETKRNAPASSSTSTRKKQRRFTQEELLLEAATMTEPENERWLLARKRVQESEHDSQKGLQEEKRGKVICKFRSRRGCLNSITFPEMDHVPDILARKHVAPVKPKVPTECVITGKKARYRDPKTMLGYHDIASFKELRRRLEAGEPLDQRAKKADDTDVPMLQAEQGSDKVSTTTDSTHPAKGSVSATAVAPAAKPPGKISKSDQSSAGEAVSAAKPAAAVAKADQPLLPKESDAKQKQPTSTPAPGASKEPGPSKTEVASSKVPQAVKSTAVAAPSTTTAKRTASPRRRKPSAKAMAAVETALLSPSKTPISSVILNMTATQPALEQVPFLFSSDGQPRAPSQIEKKAAKEGTTKGVSKSTDRAADASAGGVDDQRQASASPTKASMISNAMEMYNKLKQDNE